MSHSYSLIVMGNYITKEYTQAQLNETEKEE